MNTINFQQICNALLLIMIITITLQFTSSMIFSTLIINNKYLSLKLGSSLNMLKNVGTELIPFLKMIIF